MYDNCRMVRACVYRAELAGRAPIASDARKSPPPVLPRSGVADEPSQLCVKCAGP
jgi:hypothetical protein